MQGSSSRPNLESWGEGPPRKGSPLAGDQKTSLSDFMSLKTHFYPRQLHQLKAVTFFWYRKASRIEKATRIPGKRPKG